MAEPEKVSAPVAVPAKLPDPLKVEVTAPVVVPVVEKLDPVKIPPKKFTTDEIREAEKVVSQPYYKLNFRTAAGAIRGDINKEVVRQISSRWSDLLRVIPQHRWITFDEILQLAWDFENRSLRKLYTRTRKQIEDGVAELVSAGVLEKKN